MQEPMSEPIPTDAPAETDPSPGFVPLDVLTTWDARLQKLWDSSLSVGLEVAEALYAREDAEEFSPEVLDFLTTLFRRNLTSRNPRMPASPSARYEAVIAAVWRVLRAVREKPTLPFVEDYLAVALRPVRRLNAGILTPEICAALYDFHRGIWTPHLMKSQLYVIQVALAKTIAALPPDSMQAYWQNLQSEDSMVRHAMLLGLEFLRSAHAVPHLLVGLTTSRDHAIRSAIVDCLEQIGDPRAIAPLMQLRRETAASDWTLARHIGRVVRVIEQQNQDEGHRTLLRAATTPDDAEESLLRPAADSARIRDQAEAARLLRPVEAPDQDDAP
jgi:hypothetical protein